MTEIDNFLERDLQRLIGYFKAEHKPNAPVELEVSSDELCIHQAREAFKQSYLKAIEGLQEKVKGRDIVSMEVRTPIDDVYRDRRFIVVRLTALKPWAGDKWEYRIPNELHYM